MVAEVSLSSADIDLGEKRELYAAGVREHVVLRWRNVRLRWYGSVDDAYQLPPFRPTASSVAGSPQVDVGARKAHLGDHLRRSGRVNGLVCGGATILGQNS